MSPTRQFVSVDFTSLDDPYYLNPKTGVTLDKTAEPQPKEEPEQ